MRRILTLFLVLAFLLGTAIAEYVPTGAPNYCPHVVIDFENVSEKYKDYVLEYTEDLNGFSIGLCTLCDETFIFCTAEAAEANKLVCDGEVHFYIRSPEVIEEGWYRDHSAYNGTVSMFHDYLIFYRAQCCYCHQYIKSYVRPHNEEDKPYIKYEQHQLTDVETAVNYHVVGTNKHAYVVSCTVCGYTTVYEETCVVHDSGYCNKEMREFWAYYGK